MSKLDVRVDGSLNFLVGGKLAREDGHWNDAHQGSVALAFFVLDNTGLAAALKSWVEYEGLETVLSGLTKVKRI